MRSVLTRKVFRAVVANEPYCIATCSRRPPTRRSRQLTGPSLYQIQSRSLFGLGAQAPIPLPGENRRTSTSLEGSTTLLAGLVRAQRHQNRLPDVRRITAAFKTVLSCKQDEARLSRNEVHLLTEALAYIQAKASIDGDVGNGLLSDADLMSALSTLAACRGKDKYRSDSKALAYRLFSEYRRRQNESEKATKEGTVSDRQVTETYLAVLASTGGAREAWDILNKSDGAGMQISWVEVIKGLHSEGLERDIPDALEEMRRRTGDLTAENQEKLLAHFARIGSVLTTKQIYGERIADNALPTVDALVHMAHFCIRHRELAWGKQTVLTRLRSMQHNPLVWDPLVVWSAAQGARQGDITALLDQLSILAGKAQAPFPTMATFNSLIEYAYSVDDPRMVQVYLKLVKQHGLLPDAKTILSQLDYEIRVGNLEDALPTFYSLGSQDMIADGSDVIVLNKLLSALCFSPNPKSEDVSQVLNSILASKGHLDANTISGLCKVFLEQDTIEETLGILRHRVESYPQSDRALISQTVMLFVMNENVSDQRAYNAYELLRTAFPETTVDSRLRIMETFFKRKRPDIACLVFGHTRMREDPACRPNAEAYAQCFEGIAKCRDIDGLQMIYNVLKLDLEVDPSTHTHNGLMAAYTACSQPFTAIISHFWKILTSKDGPTMSTFALALRACEAWVPQGATEARRIIAMMQAWDIEITKQIYDSYIGAIAGQSEFENAIELIEEMENDIGVPPDAITIGTFYNAIPWQYRKDEVEAWAKQVCPDLWQELEGYGDDVDEEWEIRYFKLDRSVDPNDELIYQEGEYKPEIAQQTAMRLDAPS